jgi:deazaflavin-dependent oxidoreductase (nitroreductase family)
MYGSTITPPVVAQRAPSYHPADTVMTMPLEGEYEPNTMEWVRDQVDKIERSGGTEGTTLRGMAVIVVTNRGRKSGKLRKIPLMRVEHDGKYAAVASLGGAPKNPVWYYNLKDDPHVEVQDGTTKIDMVAREITGDEKAEWWERAVAAFPDYADYQAKTERVIPVFVLEPAQS